MTPNPAHGTYKVTFANTLIPSLTVTTNKDDIAYPLDQVGEQAELHFRRTTQIPAHVDLLSDTEGGVYRDTAGTTVPLITTFTIKRS